MKSTLLLGLLALSVWPSDETGAEAVDMPALQVKAERKPGSGIRRSVRIGEEDLEGNRGVTVAETLDRQAGVASLSTGVGIAKPILRGLANHRIIVLVDGLKQEGQQWGADHGLELAPFQIREVTLVKGPGALKHGSDAMGGVLAFSTVPLTLPRGLHVAAESGYQGLNDLGFGALSADWQGEHQGLHVYAGMQDYGDYAVPADSFTYNGYRLPVAGRHLKNTSGAEQQAGLAFTTTTANEKSESWLQLAGRFYHLEAGLFSGAVGAPRAYLLQEDASRRNIATPRQKVMHAAFMAHAGRESDTWLMTLDAGHQWNDRGEYSRPHLHGAAVPGTTASDPELANGLSLHTLSFKSEIARNMARKTQRPCRVTFGINGQWQFHERAGFEYLLPDYQRGTAGAFALWEQALAAHSDWSAGLRYDLTATETRAHAVRKVDIQSGETLEDIRAMAASRLDGSPTLALGLGKRWPKIGISSGAHFGTSFRQPHPSETVSNGVHHGNFRHEIGDTTLQSEYGYQFDAFVMQKRGPLTLQVEPFFWLFDDFIYLAPSGRFSTLPDAGQVYQYRQHNAVFTGAEASVAWQGKNLRLEQVWEYLWTLNLETHLPLPFSPPWSVLTMAQSEWPLALAATPWMHQVGAKIDMHYTARAARVDRNEAATSGYVKLDVGVDCQWQWGSVRPKWQFQVKNALNARHQNHLSRYRLLNLPEPGRYWSLQVKVPFSV